MPIGHLPRGPLPPVHRREPPAPRHLRIGDAAGRGNLARRGVPRRHRSQAAPRGWSDHRTRHPAAGSRGAGAHLLGRRGAHQAGGQAGLEGGQAGGHPLRRGSRAGGGGGRPRGRDRVPPPVARAGPVGRGSGDRTSARRARGEDRRGHRRSAAGGTRAHGRVGCRRPSRPHWPAARIPVRSWPTRRPSRSATRRPSPRTSGTRRSSIAGWGGWSTPRRPDCARPSWPPARSR